MIGRVLARALIAWAAVTALACVVVRRAFSLDVDEAHPRSVIASVWSGGQLVARAVLSSARDGDPNLDAAMAAYPGATLVRESVIGEAPVLTWPESALAMSLVPGRDGLAVTWRGRVSVVTPDDLLAQQAYDRGLEAPALSLSAGVDVPWVLAILAERAGATVRDLLDAGRWRRIRVTRSIAGEAPRRAVTAETMTDAEVRSAVVAAAGYLARGVDDVGRFRYIVDAPTNRTLPGYDFPRHAGATYFLSQAAALTGDAAVGSAAVRAAGWLLHAALVRCGERSCVGSGRLVDLGSTALTVLAFVEIARSGLDPSYAVPAGELAEFLRSQQRLDGEFMHLYDRDLGRPVDVQLLYYSGEAALALSRAHALLGDARDLDAAARSVERLTGPDWSFLGSRYYFGEEHWTCQAMADLWDRVPNRVALDFCLRWQEHNRKLQYRVDTEFDATGAYGVGPILSPRFTPVASRAEAGLATLTVALRAGVPPKECAELEAQLRSSIALLLRHRVGGAAGAPRHLLTDPGAVEGAMPGSAVDWRLRIDYTQHTGSALVRWLDLAARR